METEIANIITAIASITIFINLLLALGVLFFEKRDPGYTWAWLLVLFFLPIVGFLIYIFLGRSLKQNNFYRLTNEEQKLLKEEVDTQLKLIDEEKRTDIPWITQYEELITMNLRSSHARLSEDNEMVIFNDGHKKFDALFEDIAAAKQEINIQYYIIQPDNLGRRLRDALITKAKEGVKVRVLYDEVGSKKLPSRFFDDLKKAGGLVRVFFPSFLKLINFRINNRNHRKLVIIDGALAYVGGFNVGDEYLGEDKKFGYWRDTHFKIYGNAVNDIQTRYIMDWHQAGKDKQHDDYKDFCFHLEKHHGKSPVQVVSSGPNSETEHLKNMYIKMILSAKESVCIQTPYFIPDTSFMDACKMALLSGVDIRIMIPCKPDHPFVYWATWAYAGDLLDYGAKILLYDNGFLHAKTIVVDKKIACVGTMNIDSRSFRLNFEVSAATYDESVSEELYRIFEEDCKLCSELTPERYSKRSLWIKFKEGISRLLSPIL
ncbi:cardiolipin synthase [Oceanobacillus neutriphilus]|uniref:Cardiolipin synthase n=1 Tax=Oceanobacillus neutriphilus TaxID=531815 RepID=A0ABQ2NU58_9BACI|nr:cardiolipin synthase [Oceanobacillus neutriphilus]GGP10585.1 major cardiolipin synthase ClsA [Oceanobacillus neutriphilus]